MATSKKILILTEAYGGGIATHINIINHNLTTFEIINVFSTRNNNDYSLPKANKVILLNELSSTNPFIFIKALKKVSDIIDKHNIDLVHAHSSKAGIAILLLKMLKFKNSNLKYVFTPHAYYSQKPKLGWKKNIVIYIEKLICKFASKIIHVSQDEENHAIDNLIVKKDKSEIIYNGIKKPSKEIRTNYNKEKLVFGNLARLDEQKNPQKFYEIARAVISKSDIPVEFIYAGEGELLEHMRKKAQKDGLQDSIKFIGFIKDINSFFNRIDFYLSTSHYEGLPYSVIEAMAYKKPLFLSDVIGHRELIDGNGLLFELESDSNSISDQIVKVIKDKRLLEQYSEQSYRIFEDYFTQDKILADIKQLYRNVLKSKSI